MIHTNTSQDPHHSLIINTHHHHAFTQLHQTPEYIALLPIIPPYLILHLTQTPLPPDNFILLPLLILLLAYFPHTDIVPSPRPIFFPSPYQAPQVNPLR